MHGMSMHHLTMRQPTVYVTAGMSVGTCMTRTKVEERADKALKLVASTLLQWKQEASDDNGRDFYQVASALIYITSYLAASLQLTA